MIADAMASYPEPAPGWEVVVFDDKQTEFEKQVVLAECHEEGGITELHWAEPRFMTEDEMRKYDRHLEPMESPIA